MNNTRQASVENFNEILSPDTTGSLTPNFGRRKFNVRKGNEILRVKKIADKFRDGSRDCAARVVYSITK